jgi:hypothetical protein
MLDRIIFLPVCIAVAISAWYLGFGYIGLGILIGVAIPVFSAVRGEPFVSGFKTGAFVAFLGIACYLGAIYFARKYGMSLEELDVAREVPKHIRRLPYYGIAAMTTGVVLIVFSVIDRGNRS